MTSHNLKTRIDIKAFNALFDKSPDSIITLYIIVYGEKYEYKTKRIREENDGTITDFYWILDKKGLRVFFINITDGVANSDIDLTGKDLLRIATMTALETIYYIRTWFYYMLDITYIEILDVARNSCKDDMQRKYVYNLIAYRIFATQLPLESISIYSNFYNYKRVPLFEQRDIDSLNYFRNMTLGTLKLKLKLYLEKNMKMSTLKKELLSQYIYVLIMLIETDNRMTLYEFFKDFFKLDTCQDYAKILSIVHMFLMEDERYRKLYTKINQYRVKNTDSVYYKIENPVSKYKIDTSDTMDFRPKKLTRSRSSKKHSRKISHRKPRKV